MVENILPEIKGILPDYTDHSIDHVENVLSNAGKLLDFDNGKNKLHALDLYCLILSILFHDTGNIFGRKDHHKKISKIYNFACPETTRDKQEKILIQKVTEAHTGEARDGTKDTLKELDERFPFHDDMVRLRDIAAIVRFADELAEGRQRTSLFMLKNHKYGKKSKIFHNYADTTKITIDAGNERIALTYNIDLKIAKPRDLKGKSAKELKELLMYIYQRIDKLNQERKYAKHYCNTLTKFKRLTITFNFLIDGERQLLNLPEDLNLTDLVVPGDTDKGFLECYKVYEVKNVIDSIRAV